MTIFLFITTVLHLYLHYLHLYYNVLGKSTFLYYYIFKEFIYRIIIQAHCISSWSHNFRPSYLRLRKLLRDHSDSDNSIKMNRGSESDTACLNAKCVLALTATATEKVIINININININNIRVITHLHYPQ